LSNSHWSGLFLFKKRTENKNVSFQQKDAKTN